MLPLAAAAIGHIALWSRPLGPGIYTSAILAASVLVVGVGLLLSARRRLPLGRTMPCLAVTAVAMVVGARLLYWANHLSAPPEDRTALAAVDFTAFSLYGGLILACAAGFVTCRRLKLDPWTLGDCLAPAIGLGIAAARVGCFLHGCCLGRPTDLPWAVRYPYGSLAHFHQAGVDPRLLFTGPLPVHPTQLYELLAALTAAALAVFLLRRRARSGVPCLSAAILFTTFRCLNEPLRADSAGFLTAHLILYGALILAAALALTHRAHRRGRAIGECRGKVGECC